MLTRGAGLGALVGLLSGCAATVDRTADGRSDTPSQEVSAVQVDAATLPSSTPAFLSLKPESQLAHLAKALDQIALDRSAAVQQRLAAEAILRATKFKRYPQLAPTGSAPLTGDGESSLGLSLEQVIWDGGRIRTELTKDELDVADAGLRAWLERNEMVQDGLEAYVDMSRVRARLDVYESLRKDLQNLDERLEARAVGGIADRGERLRMRVALQEVQRSIIRNQSELRQAQADLVHALARDTLPPPLADFQSAAQSCRREWPATEAPVDALASVDLQRAKADEDLMRARRFPRLVLSAGVSTLMTPAVGVELDPADMLGLGRENNIAAAEASTEAARVAYEQQQKDTFSELARLDESHRGYQTEIQKLAGLINTNEATLELFHEQLTVGSIPIIEGITFYQENAEARVALIDARASDLVNCLRASELRGLLVPFGESNE